MPVERVTNQQHHSIYTHGDQVFTVGSTQSCHVSPSTILSVDEALRTINDQTPAPVAVKTSVNTSIIGSVVAENVYSARMVPSCHVSAIDGYAVAVEGGKPLKGIFSRVSTVNTSASGGLEPLQPGTVVRISIGAPLPPNANAVIGIEDTRLVPSGSGLIEIVTDDIAVGKNVREPGSYIADKSQIFAPGDTLSPVGGAVSLLAMAGVQTVKVFEKPRVGILGISNGVTEHTRQIGDASRLAVVSGLVSSGFEFVDLGIVRSTSHDESERALCAKTDVILLIADASVNELDLKPTIEGMLGGLIHFDHVQMKPSRHTLFATVPVKAAGNALPQRTSRPIFSLPNDTASALVAFNLFVLPSLNKLSGLNERHYTVAVTPLEKPQLGLPRVAVVLAHHFPLDPKRTDYHLAVVTGSRSDARLYATSISVQATGAQDLLRGSSIKANALIILRAGRGVGIKGEIVEALLMGPVCGSDMRLIC